MTKYFKPAILILCLSLWMSAVFSQTQTDVKDQISQRFIKYCESVAREEIYVHTDREYYIAGENMWFNVYLLYRNGNIPAKEDKLVYFELLNQENRPVIQKRILMDKGCGPGQIIIPDSLSSGVYTLRVYTSWMKNFLPENCFMMDVNIYNAFSKKAFTNKSYVDKSESKSEVNEDLTLAVNNLNPDTMVIRVTASDKYCLENNNRFHLFIQTQGKIDRVSSEILNSGFSKIAIPRKMIASGINHVTLFDSNGRPLCERLVYSPFKENQFLTVSLPSYLSSREEVSVGIELQKTLKELDSANISISVIPYAQANNFPDLDDYMLFGSEFGITPLTYLKGRKIIDLRQGEADSLLSRLKSNWIVWDKILSGQQPLNYKHETDGHFLSGKLINRNSDATGSSSFIFMSTPGKDAVFQYAKTDSEGNFNFKLNIDDRFKDLIIQPSVADENSRIRIESPFSDAYLQSRTSVDTADKVSPWFVSKSVVNYQVNKIYETPSMGTSDIMPFTPIKPKRFYGKPDVEILMKDYIKLPVMEEVFFELIVGAFLKNKKTGYELTITDPVTNKVYEKPPYLMVDGVKVISPDIIAAIDPEIVEKVDLIRELYFVGDYLFYGIVNIITNDADFSSVTLPDYASRLQYMVVEPVKSFSSPDYSKEDLLKNRVPDFRNTTYWNPAIHTDSEGKSGINFWTSDILSDYVVNIQGITKDGRLMSFRKTISVR